jgi:thioredoxin reductase
MVTATIVGSGPNGLSAAIVLASAGIEKDETRRECASLKKFYAILHRGI